MLCCLSGAGSLPGTSVVDVGAVPWLLQSLVSGCTFGVTSGCDGQKCICKQELEQGTTKGAHTHDTRHTCTDAGHNATRATNCNPPAGWLYRHLSHTPLDLVARS